MFRRNPKHAALVEQYMDALLLDPTATPPEGLDEKTVMMIRLLMGDTPPSADVDDRQDKVWDQVLFMIHCQPDLMTPPPTENTEPRRLESVAVTTPLFTQATHLLRQTMQPALLAFVVIIVFMGGVFLQTELTPNGTNGNLTDAPRVALNIPEDIQLDAGESPIQPYYQPVVYYTPVEDIPMPENATLSEGTVSIGLESIPTPRADYNLIVR